MVKVGAVLDGADYEERGRGGEAPEADLADRLGRKALAALDRLHHPVGGQDLACLGACAYAVGLTGVGLTALLAAYVAGMATSGLSLLPGGLGAVDAALVLGLVAAGSPATVALSAVVLYRMISLAGVVAAGWVVHAVQRRR